MGKLFAAKPSNPAAFFVTGNEEKEFTYDPGPDPYYVIVHAQGYIALSVMVFANSYEHARTIVCEMVAFKQACVEEYQRSESYDKHDLGGRDQNKIDALTKALAGDPAYRVDIGPAARGQMYKIGWASNDTL